MKLFKLRKILEDSLHSIPSPSPPVKIQIRGGVVAFTTQASFHALNLNFTKCEGDGIESRLPFKIFSTLPFVFMILFAKQLKI